MTTINNESNSMEVGRPDFMDMDEPNLMVVNEDESFLTVVIIVVKPYQGSVYRKEFKLWRCLLTFEESARDLVPRMLSIAGVPSRHSASEGSIKFMVTSASSLSKNKHRFYSYFVEIKERGVTRCYRTFRLQEYRSVDIVVHLAYEKFAHEMRCFRNLEKMVNTEEDGSCIICLEDIPKEREVLGLPCLHFYHNSCIVKWLETHSTCPLCRFKLD